MINLKYTWQWNKAKHSYFNFIRDIIEERNYIPLAAGSVTCSFSRLVIEIRIFSSTTFFDSSGTLGGGGLSFLVMGTGTFSSGTAFFGTLAVGAFGFVGTGSSWTFSGYLFQHSRLG